MGYFLNYNTFTELNVLIPNSELINIAAGSSYQFYDEPNNGFVPIGAMLQYINGTVLFSLDAPGITLQNNSNDYASYVDPGGTVNINNNYSIVFLTGYNPITMQFSSNDRYIKQAIAFEGNYVTGDGDLLLTLFGKFVNI